MSRRFGRRAAGIEDGLRGHNSGMSGDHHLPRDIIISRPALQATDSQRSRTIHRRPVTADPGIGRIVTGDVIEQATAKAGEVLGLPVEPLCASRLLYFGHKALGHWGLRGGDDLLTIFKGTADYDPALSEGEFDVRLGRFTYSIYRGRLLREIHLPSKLLQVEVRSLCKAITGLRPAHWSQHSSLLSKDGVAVRFEVGGLYPSTDEQRANARALSEWEGWDPEDTVTVGPLQVIPYPDQSEGYRPGVPSE